MRPIFGRILSVRRQHRACAEAGIPAIVQPGGSIRDDEVIAAAEKGPGLAMVLLVSAISGIKPTASNSLNATVDITIPVYNEEDVLPRTIASSPISWPPICLTLGR
ncbi:MAG: hypothetical protein CM1200mP22_26670 [Dehalococcoidia bacterium]|nr:MAG: hypothetical protein CM1200mP22_26670 [Dehalococcoidia bacterium]